MKRTILSMMFGFFKILLVVSFSVAAPISSFAQSGKTPLPAGKAISEKIVVDWNGDGLFDLILGDRDGFVTVYLNEGSNDSPKYGSGTKLRAGGKEIKVRGPSAPILVDWNGDGKRDLLVGDRGGYLHLFLNQGSNRYPEFAPAGMIQAVYKDFDVVSNASPCVVDWNADGRMDLLVGKGDGELYLYLNEGTKDQPMFGKPIKINDGKLDVGSNSSPDMGDLHGEGKKDLIVGNDNGEVFIFRNQGKDGDPQFDNLGRKIFLIFNNDASPRVIDWIQSGSNDFVVADRYGEVTLCPNKGSSKAPSFTEKRIIRARRR